MANKHQVLKLLEKGETPSQIAKKLGCDSAYVRATRQRATPVGLKKSRKWALDYVRRKKLEQRV